MNPALASSRRRRRTATYIQVATYFEWTTSPSGVTLNAIGATATVTAQVTDQFHVPMRTGQPTVTYTSGTTANVTVSGSTLTAVANGTSVITAHAATGGWTDVTGTATVQQVLASITISPTTPTVANGTGQTFTKAGKDRLGVACTVGAGTWASSDSTDFPITTGGVCTPNVDSGSSVIQFTETASGISGTTTITATTAGGVAFDTTSYNATTGAGIGGSTGAAPVAFDAASNNANDAAFRAKIGYWGGVGSGAVLAPYENAALAGTKTVDPGSALYNSGKFPDLVLWQNSVLYSGQPTYELTIRGVNLASSAPIPQPALGVPAGTYSMWVWVRRRYPNGFTPTGDATGAGATFNATQDNALKCGPVGGMNNGRAAMEMSNGTSYSEIFTNTSDIGTTIAESGSGAAVASEWTDNAWYDYLIHAEQWTGANGHTYLGISEWRRKVGDAAYTRLGGRRTQDTGQTGHITFIAASGFPLNYNQSRSTDLKYYIWGHAAWDESTNSDPFGVLAHEATLTPEACTVNSVTSQTSTTATFPVTIGRYAKYVRPVIDGTEDAAQEYAIPLETPDIDPSSNGTTPAPAMVLSLTVTGLDTAAHTISFNVYNGNKTASVNTGNQSINTAPVNLLSSPTDLTNTTYWTTVGSSVAQVSGITLPDSSTGTVSRITFSTGAHNDVEQAVTIPGGTASKQFTVSAYVRMVSGTGTAAVSNTQGGVLANFESDQSITTAWTLLTFQVTNGSSTGTGKQIFAITNGSAGPAESIYVYGMTATQP